MSTDSSTIVRPKPIRWGDTVFLKVEEIIFEVPRHRFSEMSEVFKDMFQLPVGNEQEEGRDEEHPIVLDGYKATDFNALIKILYPMPHDVISGSYTLTKEEWTGVLNLSTRWEMREIRKYSIQELTKLSLSPVEKVVLARQCKVAKWLEEGLNELVTEHPVRSLAELKSQLGLDTACTLLWARSQASEMRGLLFTLGSMRCGACKAVMFTKSRNCSKCHQEIQVNNRGDLYILGDTLTVGFTTTVDDTSGPALMEPYIDWENLRCRKCNSCPFNTNFDCPACSTSTSECYTYFRPAIATPGSKPIIMEEFRDEIATYESGDRG